MSEYKMRGEDGDPLHDLADVCNYNESLIVDAVNQERAEASARRKSERGRSRRGR